MILLPSSDMRFLTYCFLVLVLCGCFSTAHRSQPTLVGRWQAETVPTGYWIIDRYPDGTFAKKHFLKFDSAKPAEILISWGRWEYKGGDYRELIEGSTSDFVNREAKEWKDIQVDGLENDIFHIRSQEGYGRKEFRISRKKPLTRVSMKEPEKGAGGLIPPQQGVVETDLTNIPDWIDASPRWIGASNALHSSFVIREDKGFCPTRLTGLTRPTDPPKPRLKPTLRLLPAVPGTPPH